MKSRHSAGRVGSSELLGGSRRIREVWVLLGPDLALDVFLWRDAVEGRPFEGVSSIVGETEEELDVLGQVVPAIVCGSVRHGCSPEVPGSGELLVEDSGTVEIGAGE